MLAYKEIKNDIKNGYEYMEYYGKWYGMEYTIILEKDGLVFHFMDNKNNLETVFHLYKELFEGFTSYKEYTNYINQIAYYNMQEMEG